MSPDAATGTRTHDAEQAVLSAILLAPETLSEIDARLAPADFASGRHARIFAAMQEAAASGQQIDPITVSHILEVRGQLESVGGKDYIAELLDVVPTTTHIASHALIVHQDAQRRALATTFARQADLAREGHTDPLALALSARDALDRFAGATATEGSGLALYDDDEIAAIPTPAWLIDGVLPSRALALLVGEKGTLKTFAALDVASSVQLGLEWQGRRVRAGAAVYVYAEGHTAITPRVEAWKRLHGVDRLGMLFLPQRVTLNEPSETAHLLAAITARLGHREVALIVVDTLNRNMTGNENASDDMSAFVRGCDQLREATGATVLVVHHKGHGQDDRGRGSSVLDAAADTIIFASRDADRLTLDCRKQKDAGEFPSFAFEAVPSGQSLVLKPSGVTAGALKGQRLLLLTALHENSTADGATYKAWADWSGLGNSSFNKARELLKANGLVEATNGKWKVTAAGRIALSAAHSTPLHSTPLNAGGVRGTTPLHSGGVYKDPPVEWSGAASMPRKNDHGHAARSAGAQTDVTARAIEPLERLSARLLELAQGATADPVTMADGDRTPVLELLAKSPIAGPLRARAFRAVRFGATRAELRAIGAELAQ